MTQRRTVTSAPQLTAVRVDERDGTAVVAIRGDIDTATAPLIRDALAWAVGCHTRVVVDLSAAGSIDRTGLSVILAAQDRAASRAVQMCFSAPSPQLSSALGRIRASEMLAGVEAPAVRRPDRPESGTEAAFTLPRIRGPLSFDAVAA